MSHFFQIDREILLPKTGYNMPTLPIARPANSIFQYINTNRLLVSVNIIYCLANSIV